MVTGARSARGGVGAVEMEPVNDFLGFVGRRCADARG